MNKKIILLQKTIKNILTSEPYRKHFNVSGIQGSTINILGALTVLTEFDSLIPFENQINSFNNDYYNLINHLDLDEFSFLHLHSFYNFCDSEYNFDIDEKINDYKFIFDINAIKSLAQVILKFVKNYKKQTNDNKEYLKKLSYFIALTYVSNHERDNVSVFITENFKDEDEFNDELCSSLLESFETEINVFKGKKENSLNSLLNDLSEVEEYIIAAFVNNEQRSKDYFDKLKYQLIFSIIPEYKIYNFVYLFLTRYKKDFSENQIFLFSDIIITIFEKMLRNRF